MEPNFMESTVTSSNYWKRPREDHDDRSFNFNIKPEDMEYHRGRKSCKQQRDPMSHRIIEKRRRDRMNNCLADLSKLIPHGYIKQGQGRIEKTEIIEMAIKHITSLQVQVKHANKSDVQVSKDEVRQSFIQGFQQCKKEVFNFLVDVEGVSASNPFCSRVCVHLDKKSKEMAEEVTDLQVKPGKEINTESETKFLPIDTDTKCLLPNEADTSKKMTCDADNNDVAMGMTAHRMSDLETDSGVSIKSINNNSTFSSQTSSDDSMEERSKTSKGYYKFKHCIRRRFSKEKESDTSSVSSHEQEREVRPKHVASRYHKSCHSSSPMSSCSSSSSLNNMSITMDNTNNEKREDGESSLTCLPGFVIHPSGTHYVPISVNQSFLPDLFESSSYSSQKVFHPISIPVHFCAAYALKV
ncbi:hypothetical protein SNE40_013808 [Patella caerulea]|uniref:BHLH domain-containing protein n=1 Tax=Patella caerulea TaxID=87958 RepID=A0AAN8PR66_PATCE